MPFMIFLGIKTNNSNHFTHYNTHSAYLPKFFAIYTRPHIYQELGRGDYVVLKVSFPDSIFHYFSFSLSGVYFFLGSYNFLVLLSHPHFAPKHG